MAAKRWFARAFGGSDSSAADLYMLIPMNWCGPGFGDGTVTAMMSTEGLRSCCGGDTGRGERSGVGVRVGVGVQTGVRVGVVCLPEFGTRAQLRKEAVVLQSARRRTGTLDHRRVAICRNHYILERVRDRTSEGCHFDGRSYQCW